MTQLYHASPTAGLTVLQPRPSTHGRPYVYAIENRVTALLFGAKHDDFDFIISEENGRPLLEECYPGAFEKIYADKGCTLYTVAADGFLRGVTGWEPEWVSEAPAPVLYAEVVPDLCVSLRQQAQQGALVLRTYQHDAAYRGRVAAHIVDRLIRFEVDLRRCLTGPDLRFAVHYRGLVQALIAVQDGHLLA